VAHAIPRRPTKNSGTLKLARLVLALWIGLLSFASTLWAGPVIDPLPNVILPAGKSIIIPITATVTNGQPLTYTVTGSTNAMALVLHTNNPFWKLNVAQACATNAVGAFTTPFRGGLATVTNVGDLTFMLFPEYAPNTVAIFQGLSAAGFFNSNTIFHRVITNFMIQGGDPDTNGTGGLVFEYNDEFKPQAIFSGKGQLALANSGKNTDMSQFFVTVGQQRSLDFQYTLFGQLVRGFNVLSNIDFTTVNTNSRPLAPEIITLASFVPDTVDTVLTITTTNRNKITNLVTVVASDGVGGLATNTFKAISRTDTNSNDQPLFYGSTISNLVTLTNVTLTNVLDAVDLDGKAIYWFPFYGDSNSEANATISYNPNRTFLHTSTYNETNVGGEMELFVKPRTNYAGPITVLCIASENTNWNSYYKYYSVLGYLPPYCLMPFTFVFGDTPITGQAAAIAAQPTGSFTNLLLATFTNGVPGSSATNFSAVIQWGDDSLTSNTATTNAASLLKQVYGSHDYLYAGDYPITITIQSGLGVSTVVSNTITVPPSVSLTYADSNAILSWPAWAFAYELQGSTNLAGTNWTAATNTAVLSGFQNILTNTPPAGQAFFRLTH
jgi:cyclophilin family peptidyl-prolyl cis-trans isomerase